MITKKRHPLLFNDNETTGHDPLRKIGNYLVPWHEIIDMGAILVDPDTLEVLDTFEQKVIPTHPERCLPNLVNHYPERARRGEWKNAVYLEPAVRKFLEFAGSRGVPAVVLGQNYFFDWSFISVAFAWCGIMESEWGRYLHYTKLDTRSMSVQELLRPGEVYDPDEFSIRNGKLLERLGIEPEPEVHAAINGARKAFEVYKKLREIKRPTHY